MVLYRFYMAVDLDKPIKRDHTANVKNHGIRRLAPTSVYFNGIPSIKKGVLSQRKKFGSGLWRFF